MKKTEASLSQSSDWKEALSEEEEIIDLEDIVKKGVLAPEPEPVVDPDAELGGLSEEDIVLAPEEKTEAGDLDFQFEDTRGSPLPAVELSSGPGPDEDLDNVLAGLKTQLEKEDDEVEPFGSGTEDALGLSREEMEELLTRVVSEVVEKTVREAVAEVAEKVIREAIDALKQSLEANAP